ncbi:MAG: 3-dehydroquinate synthase [Deltaproteobacteria bacterium]|nr:3-dehydroquinate synthase [Deltaproteobacteria bacterium]
MQKDLAMKKITVNLEQLARSSYDICIGNDIEGEIAQLIAQSLALSAPMRAPAAVISDSNVMSIHGERFLESLHRVGINATIVPFPAGESSKNILTVTKLAESLLDLGMDRSSKIIALGGGVVGDVAGFVASIYMRGIPHIQIPTSLIAQTDSSIGGKTAVDLPQGKNLLGTFLQPAAVFIDVRFLATLPEREFSNGMAEVIKYGLLNGEEFFSYIESNIGGIMHRETSALMAVVERCCRIKKGIVEIDEKEKGSRRFLNLGHTVGHAIEAAADYQISHGEAIAIGMLAALRLSSAILQLPNSVGERVERILRTAGIPTRLPSSVDTAAIFAKLKTDKKREGNKMNFILLQDIGLPLVADNVLQGLLTAIIEDLRQ